MPPHQRALTPRNGNGDGSQRATRTRLLGVARSNGRKRDTEDTALCRRLPGRDEPTRADLHCGSNDDSKPQLPVPGSLQIPGEERTCRTRSDSDCGPPAPGARVGQAIGSSTGAIATRTRRDVRSVEKDLTNCLPRQAALPTQATARPCRGIARTGVANDRSTMHPETVTASGWRPS